MTTQFLGNSINNKGVVEAYRLDRYDNKNPPNCIILQFGGLIMCFKIYLKGLGLSTILIIFARYYCYIRFMIKFKHLEYFDTSWSILLIAIAVVQWIIDAPWLYIGMTLLFLFLLWVISIILVMYYRPWNSNFRSDILKPFSGIYPFKIFFKTVFVKPMYESKYIIPLVDELERDKQPLNVEYAKSKITVIVEDDPVGYMCHRGNVPAFIVDENVKRDNLFNTLMESKARIEEKSVFFLATPSRRLDENGSFIMNREIGFALHKFRKECSRGFRIISKIDSCLRSNYEPEFRGLTDGYGAFSLEVLIPSYIEQGRITVHGSQYIRENQDITPIHESEYSSFRGLEFKNSNLALWLASRCRHIASRKNVGLICVDKIRTQSVDVIVDKLINRPSTIQAMVFDSSDEEDLTINFNILFGLEERGSDKIYYKFGPSMINRLVMSFKSESEENHISGIHPDDTAIIVAGSLSSITKRQIADLKDEEKTSLVILNNSDIENTNTFKVIDKKRRKILEYNSRGDNVILTTEYWKASSNEYPDIQKRDKVLNLLAEICRLTNEEVKNRWIVIKGSDTALHVLNHGFGLKKFDYCGQIIPGVIHIKVQLKDNTNKSCFIIGGNVGEENLLVNLISTINQRN